MITIMRSGQKVLCFDAKQIGGSKCKIVAGFDFVDLARISNKRGTQMVPGSQRTSGKSILLSHLMCVATEFCRVAFSPLHWTYCLDSCMRAMSCSMAASPSLVCARMCCVGVGFSWQLGCWGAAADGWHCAASGGAGRGKKRKE